MRITKAQISLCNLISAFVVLCLDSIMPILFKTLASLYTLTDRFGPYLVANPEDRFSGDAAISSFKRFQQSG